MSGRGIMYGLLMRRWKGITRDSGLYFRLCIVFVNAYNCLFDYYSFHLLILWNVCKLHCSGSYVSSETSVSTPEHHMYGCKRQALFMIDS